MFLEITPDSTPKVWSLKELVTSTFIYFNKLYEEFKFQNISHLSVHLLLFSGLKMFLSQLQRYSRFTFHELPEKRSEMKYFSVRKSTFSVFSSSIISDLISSIGFPSLSKSQNPKRMRD